MFFYMCIRAKTIATLVNSLNRKGNFYQKLSQNYR